jgi:hypothetical protein
MNHFYLVISSLFFNFPLLFFFGKLERYSRLSKDFLQENKMECILAGLLFLNLIFSSFFWINPIPYNGIHILDGIFGKISLFLFSIYILFHKKIGITRKIVFLCILGLGLFLFYYSNEYSREDWCCDEHIFYHFIFHIMVASGCSLSFI